MVFALNIGLSFFKGAQSLYIKRSLSAKKSNRNRQQRQSNNP
jgi:hypothetical protein